MSSFPVYRAVMNQSTKDKNGDRTKTHGGTSKRSDRLLRKTYRTWSKMRQRCNDPKNNRFYLYGSRGIRVCKRWSSFDCFLADMGLIPSISHSIERRNSDGNYTPLNCKWATALEQGNNKRNNRLLTIGADTKTLAQWGRDSGLGAKLLWLRLKKGWAIDDHLLQPINSRRNSWKQLLSINGVSKPIKQWAKEAGLSYGVVFGRVRIGVPKSKLLLPVGTL